MQTTSLTLFRFSGLASRLWVLGQMALARRDMRRDPDALFWKLCGSGTGHGFTPRPNWDVWAILAVWPDEATARARSRDNPVHARWRRRSIEAWTLHLSPISARGVWAGVSPFAAQTASADGPMAVLTRATIKPSRALQFWNRVPGISAMIGNNPDVIFKIGIGEVPLLHQVTFSVWPDAASMARFARGDGPHGRAIQAVRQQGWFAEELYARFHILGSDGQWAGCDPLLMQKAAA
ncbi:MAG: spheroidene monooxygenase [Pseudomonadota bacterium]